MFTIQEKTAIQTYPRIIKTPQPVKSAICVNNLNVYAKDHQILKNVNVKIPEKKITVLLGPSGCGKTTLLKSMNRLTDLNRDLRVEGNIFIDKDDILHTDNDLAQLRQKMGLLSQRPFPLPMSIYKNVAYGLKLKGIRSKGLIAHSVEKNLREVGLWDEVKDRLHKPAASLSIGQQQRLCLARGLAVKPQIILADEPTSALDPISSNTIESLFKEIKSHYTIVLVTHILRQAKRLADHVIFMYYGEIIEEGSPEELFNNPQSEQLRKYMKDGC